MTEKEFSHALEGLLWLGGSWQQHILLQLFRKEMKFSELKRCLECYAPRENCAMGAHGISDEPDDSQALKACLEGMERQGLVEYLEENVRRGLAGCPEGMEHQRVPKEQGLYALTEFGRTTEPILRAFASWGRLCQKAGALGIAFEEGAAFSWKLEEETVFDWELEEEAVAFGRELEEEAAFAHELEAGQHAAGVCLESEVRQRHGWKRAGDVFLFFNAHADGVCWYFSGRCGEEGKTAITMISQEDYERLAQQIEMNGFSENGAASVYAEMVCSGMNPEISVRYDAADILPETEAFYIGVEDAMIEKTMFG